MKQVGINALCRIRDSRVWAGRREGPVRLNIDLADTVLLQLAVEGFAGDGEDAGGADLEVKLKLDLAEAGRD